MQKCHELMGSAEMDWVMDSIDADAGFPWRNRWSRAGQVKSFWNSLPASDWTEVMLCHFHPKPHSLDVDALGWEMCHVPCTECDDCESDRYIMARPSATERMLLSSCEHFIILWHPWFGFGKKGSEDHHSDFMQHSSPILHPFFLHSSCRLLVFLPFHPRCGEISATGLIAYATRRQHISSYWRSLPLDYLLLLVFGPVIHRSLPEIKSRTADKGRHLGPSLGKQKIYPSRPSHLSQSWLPFISFLTPVETSFALLSSLLFSLPFLSPRRYLCSHEQEESSIVTILNPNCNCDFPREREDITCESWPMIPAAVDPVCLAW